MKPKRWQPMTDDDRAAEKANAQAAARPGNQYQPDFNLIHEDRLITHIKGRPCPTCGCGPVGKIKDGQCTLSCALARQYSTCCSQPPVTAPTPAQAIRVWNAVVILATP
jgi:hypothetical protein